VDWYDVLVTMTNNYTDTEMPDMHFMFSLADGSTREAHRLYKEHSVAAGSQKRVCLAGFISVSETVEHLY
jgi:hypothetical protein